MPLDEYARCHEFDPRACLNLLALVCDAVQHAHDNGIVHRDLKPGNILVDEAGEPKVLDFGVAHVTAADLLATSSQTRTGQLLGTLSYMSPEQLSGNSSVLDGRSDVYALGVILFELLAGRKPYHLDGLPVHEVARVIEQEEPSRLGSVNKFYRGDVEIIVAKALEKDRTRRYASAGDLASDIRRYLRGQPILARPASALYQIRKFARRHTALVAAVFGIFAALLVGTVVSIVFALRAAENARAQRPRTLASRANGSVRPRIRATAPGSRPRLRLSRNTTSPMPPAISTPPLSACGAGSGNTCARGSTTARRCSPQSPRGTGFSLPRPRGHPDRSIDQHRPSIWPTSTGHELLAASFPLSLDMTEPSPDPDAVRIQVPLPGTGENDTRVGLARETGELHRTSRWLVDEEGQGRRPGWKAPRDRYCSGMRRQPRRVARGREMGFQQAHR